ncbi:MAG TPA: O-antigen ligase family protein [Solirubrobacteraceae bacterium]|nr:O-antigen ligase family protein [Solirubrobacteraceae bacterium]
MSALPVPTTPRATERPPVGVLLGFAGAAVLAALLAVRFGRGALYLPFVALLVVWLCRHPVVLLTAYLSIGVFKGTTLLQTDVIVVDPTLALATLLLGVCVVRVLTGRAFKVPLLVAVPFIVIGVLLILSLTWTPVHGYGAEKALKFWTLTLLALAAPFCVIDNERDLRQLFAWLLIAAVVGALVTLRYGEVGAVSDVNNANSGRLEFGGIENTIFMSRILCAGALVALFAPVVRLGGGWWRVVLPLVGVALIAVAASIGSRGPLVSLALAGVVTLTAVVVRTPRALLPLLAMVAIGVAVLPFISLPETSAARLRGITEDPLGTLQTDGRSRLYEQAVDIARDNPAVGLGAGGFQLYSAVLLRKELRYPHNIFLEVAAEVGIAAAVVLAVSMITVLIALFRRAWASTDPRRRSQVYLVTALLLLAFFNAQVSGDINDNRTFWTALALGWLVARHRLVAERA